MVEHHYDEKDQPSGNLVCRECGAVVPDRANFLYKGILAQFLSVSAPFLSHFLPSISRTFLSFPRLHAEAF